MPRQSRRKRELSLPAFKAHRAEHWLDKHEREREELEERLRKLRTREDVVAERKQRGLQ